MADCQVQWAAMAAFLGNQPISGPGPTADWQLTAINSRKRTKGESDRLRVSPDRRVSVMFHTCPNDITLCRSPIYGISQMRRSNCMYSARTIPPGPSGSVQNRQASSNIIIRSSTMRARATTIGSKRSSARSRQAGQQSSPRSRIAKQCPKRHRTSSRSSA